MKRVFVDSGGWYAHLVAEDRNHEAARHLFQRVRDDRRSLVTTNAVMFEAHALILNRARDGRSLALKMLEQLRSGVATIVRVTRQDESRAEDLLRAHDDKGYSFCDALSFVVMERMGIADVIAFDRHFRQYGQFTLLE